MADNPEPMELDDSVEEEESEDESLEDDLPNTDDEDDEENNLGEQVKVLQCRPLFPQPR